jgi:hypothetical protein
VSQRISSFLTAILTLLNFSAAGVTLEGRLMNVNGHARLIFEQNGQTRETTVHAMFNSFRGQQVTIDGHFQTEDYFAAESLITAKSALIQSRIGQGIALRGMIVGDLRGGSIFIPSQSLAHERLGENVSYPLVFPKNSHWTQTFAFDAQLTGVISEGKLYVFEDFYTPHIAQTETSLSPGDTVVVSGWLNQHDPTDAEEGYRTHHRNSWGPSNSSLTYGNPGSDSYGLRGGAKHFADWYIAAPSDVLVKFNGREDLVRVRWGQQLFASLGTGLPEGIYHGERMTFLGQATTADHIVVTDARPYLGEGAIPTLSDIPTLMSREAELPKPKFMPRLIHSSGKIQRCAGDLTGKRPVLTVVPKE